MGDGCPGYWYGRVQSRAALERRIDIKRVQDAIGLAGNNLEALQQRRGLSTAVPLDNDVHALPELGTRRLQHLVGLADTDKNFQTPGTIIFFAPGLGREGFR